MHRHKIDGDEVRRLREELGLSVKDLADEAECHFNYLYKIEQNKRQPGPALVRRLAKALGVKPRQLLIAQPTKQVA